jgi:hypothetical protein
MVFLFLTQWVFLMQAKAPPEFVQVGMIDSEGPNDGPGEGEDDKDESPLPEEQEMPPEQPAEEVTPTQPAAEETSPDPGEDTETPDEAKVGSGSGADQGGGGDGAPEFRNRVGTGRGDALKRYGGNSRTERAVRVGLQWLARHQHPMGYWSANDFNELCEGEPCSGEAMNGYEPGHTGLALLSFLGAGHTHRKGIYMGTVKGAIDWALSMQSASGRFGNPSRCYMYNHAICLLAVAEAYGMTKDSRLREPVQRGIGFLVTTQQKGGGWDYIANATGRNDVSVTGWAVMALKSAATSGIPVSGTCWRRAKEFIRRMTHPDGQVEYEDRGFNRRRRWVRRGPGMAAVGLLCHLYFGDDPTSSRCQKIANYLRKNPPSLTALREEQLHTNYYWYYATLAFFQLGADDWHWWNERFRDFVVGLQCEEGCEAGSWDPEDGWMGPYGGRLYATTLNILCLEVYYRYLPLYKSKVAVQFEEEKDDATLETEDALRIAVDPAMSTGKRLKALQALESVSGKEASRVLEKALADPKQVIRWQAVRSLGARKDKETVPALVAALNRGSDRALTATFLRALGQIGSRKALEALLPYLSHEESRFRSCALSALQKATGKALGQKPEAWAKVIAERDD